MSTRAAMLSLTRTRLCYTKDTGRMNLTASLPTCRPQTCTLSSWIKGMPLL